MVGDIYPEKRLLQVVLLMTSLTSELFVKVNQKKYWTQ